MPVYTVELVRLRPEYLTATIEASNLDELRATIPEYADSTAPTAWTQGAPTEPTYCTANDGQECRLINFRD